MKNESAQKIDPKSPPRLVDYYITSFRFDADDVLGVNSKESERDKEGEKINITIGYQVQRHKKTPRLYKLLFLLEGKVPSNLKISFDIKVSSTFAFDEDKELDKDYMEHMIRVQGCTTLYGLLRGHIASMTALIPNGKFILPNLFMADIVRKIESQNDSKDEGKSKKLPEDKSES